MGSQISQIVYKNVEGQGPYLTHILGPEKNDLIGEITQFEDFGIITYIDTENWNRVIVNLMFGEDLL